jgi:hypothetical protein
MLKQAYLDGIGHIDYPVSCTLGLAKCHLLSCPLLTDVQLDRHRLSDVIN